ncbi:MAG: FtsX-like permease family protein [Mycobacteriales bacterium]
MIRIWVRGLLRRRAPRLGAAALGVAIAVALLASLGVFLASSKATMTERAAAGVAVDWQVAVVGDATPDSVLAATAAAPGVTQALPVGYGQSAGLQATTGGTTQTTGPAVVLGLPDVYRSAFPAAIRTLAGTDSGVLLAQQTAANLHAAPGDTVTVTLAGAAPVDVVVAGVVELPQADSLFQTVGAPAGSQPSAPPDNVLLLPAAQWHRVFDPLATVRPDLVGTQLHVARSHALAADPAAAYADVVAAANNLEAATAGGGIVGDNLAAALDAARGDAAYAQVLFLFLGLPGAVLAGLLTATVTGAGAARRRREQALLRSRGASQRQLIQLAAVEAALVGVSGTVLGLAGAALVGRLTFGSVSFGATTGTALLWTGGAAAVGLLIAAATILLPARRDLRESTVAAGRLALSTPAGPRWARYGVDIVLLAGAAGLIVLTTRTGYQLVLAPEGVPAISVSYWAFAGPALLWLGAGLLAWRLADLLLGRGRRLVAAGIRPLTGVLSGAVATGMARDRRPLARAAVLLALSVAFAASTATFNATYAQQAEADAQLTNGADVTVAESPGVAVGPSGADQIAAVNGVRSVEPLQHRFAYVGADLQDLYGVRPDTIASVTALQDSYFPGSTAAATMAELAARPDSVLVSAETVKDFQLSIGDALNLRLQDGRTKQFTTVAFHYVGVVAEFPTAPRDSFLVANADYIAAQTGSNAVGFFLVDTDRGQSTAVADRVRGTLGAAAVVTDIATTRSVVGSSLTSVDLAGLTRVELAFALLLAAAAGGLVLALGLVERRRTSAIVTALGASVRQLRGAVLAEAGVVTLGGLLAGALSGWALSQTLVKVLSGVFDPPPASLAVPWLYLGVVGLVVVTAIGAVSAGAVRIAQRPALRILREL